MWFECSVDGKLHFRAFYHEILITNYSLRQFEFDVQSMNVFSNNQSCLVSDRYTYKLVELTKSMLNIAADQRPNIDIVLDKLESIQHHLENRAWDHVLLRYKPTSQVDRNPYQLKVLQFLCLLSSQGMDNFEMTPICKYLELLPISWWDASSVQAKKEEL